MADDDIITLVEAAKLLRISKGGAYRLAERNELPGCIKVGGLYRVSRSAMLAGLGLAVAS